MYIYIYIYIYWRSSFLESPVSYRFHTCLVRGFIPVSYPGFIPRFHTPVSYLGFIFFFCFFGFIPGFIPWFHTLQRCRVCECVCHEKVWCAGVPGRLWREVDIGDPCEPQDKRAVTLIYNPQGKRVGIEQVSRFNKNRCGGYLPGFIPVS